MCDTCPEHTHHHESENALPLNARGDEFRVVVTGKGGVGKTTLTALLARRLSRRAWRVLALDADPQMNLPYALGLAPERARELVPLSENADYVEEKTGARPGDGWGLFFRLNPNVDDVVERFGLRGPGGVRILVMGNTVQPAAGCLCPENALLGAVTNSLSLRRDEAILMDTQAGFEHFGRALAKGFHHAVVVTDTTFNAMQVALHAARLARELEIPAIHLVVNRVREDVEFMRAMARLDAEGGFPFTSVNWLPEDEQLRHVEPSIEPLLTRDPANFDHKLDELLDALVKHEERLVQCAS
ncbi:MAG: AAA family ATPase [Gammaproteobacteria bacterium]|nr:AAA family ATPase [Gammaproteobacteria bacterium]NND37467.1 AAA family ATPase [Gammaproteobacteria bacterium]